MAGTVFLTGGSGFLGSRLVERLAADGRRVICAGRRKPAAQSRNVEFVPADLPGRGAWRDALEGCDAVVHLAAATGKHAPAEYFRVNRDGTAAMVEEARRAGVRRFLFASTIAVKFPDTRRYYYAQSKREAEKIVAGSGLDWTIVRPTMIFGRGSPALDGLRRLASLPVVPVFGNGRALLEPIFVDDLSAAMAALLDERASYRCVVEIGGPEAAPMEELLLRIRRAMGVANGRVVRLPARPIAALLGWLEPALRPLLPITAGQLASFLNDGTPSHNPLITRRIAGMRNIDEMLRSA